VGRSTPQIAVVEAAMKPSGSVTTFLRKLHQGDKRGTVKVPCGQCNACCRSPNVKADLLAEELADFPDAVYDPKITSGPKTTGWALPKREDGTCNYLIHDKCSIYARRPFFLPHL
jgi:hypothetical protein